MASRPKHVSTLSDKISGLKFMQRAKAVQEKSQSSSSQLVQPKISEINEKENGSNYAEVSEQKDANEEHWVLPGSALKTIRRIPTSSSIVSHEPGWNAWLIEAAEDGQASKAGIEEEEEEAASITTTTKRRLFGSWLKKGKKRKERDVDKEQDEDPDYDEEDGEESGEELSDDEKDLPKAQKEKESVGGKLKNFMKPGTYKESKSDKVKRKDIEHSGREKVRGTANKNGREKGSKEHPEKRKWQSVKKNSGREVLKGFPDQGRPLKKMKKMKSPST